MEWNSSVWSPDYSNFILISSWQHFCGQFADSYFNKWCNTVRLTLENIHVLEGRGWGKVLRILIKYNHNIMIKRIREDTHKKGVFLVVGPLRFYLPYTNGLMVLPPFFSFFFSLIIAWNGFWQFFLFLPNFWAKTAELKKKCFFA